MTFRCLGTRLRFECAPGAACRAVLAGILATLYPDAVGHRRCFDDIFQRPAAAGQSGPCQRHEFDAAEQWRDNPGRFRYRRYNEHRNAQGEHPVRGKERSDAVRACSERQRTKVLRRNDDGSAATDHIICREAGVSAVPTTEGNWRERSERKLYEVPPPLMLFSLFILTSER